MSSSSKSFTMDKDMFIGIWKSPNTDNIVKDSDYDNGMYIDYVSQSIIADGLYKHIIDLPNTYEIPESNFGINEQKDDFTGRGINIVKIDKDKKIDIKLSDTFCDDKLSSINTSYLVPEEPGYLVMILFGKDGKGLSTIICVLRFHFERLLDSFDDKNSDYYPIIAHLDGFCKNCDNANIKGAGVGIDIFFNICKKWNDESDFKIVQYKLEAVPNASLYWKKRFGFVPEYSEVIADEMVPMTRPVEDMTDKHVQDVNLEKHLMESIDGQDNSILKSVPVFTNEQMGAIDWAITWDEMTEGLEQEMGYQQRELRRGMSKSHRRAWGDDGYESDSPLITMSKRTKKTKKAKKAKGAKKTKGLKRTPRRRRNRTQRGYDSI